MQLAVLKQHLHATPAELRPEPLALPEPSPKRRSPFDGAYEESVTVPIFDARRDCRGGYDLCAHCGGSFKDHTGLKRHIEYGRCTKFDASKPPQAWILRYQPAIYELFQIVHPESRLYDRDFLLRLKQECVLCGRIFDSAARLASQGAWQGAQVYHNHLLEHYQPLGEACMCGVWVRHPGHQCPVATQLGMVRTLVRQNTDLQAWMWTTSACTELQWTDFGAFAANVGRLLVSPQAGGVSLAEHGFNPQSWGNAQQQDSGEFADSLLRHTNSPLGKPYPNCKWSRNSP